MGSLQEGPSEATSRSHTLTLYPLECGQEVTVSSEQKTAEVMGLSLLGLGGPVLGAGSPFLALSPWGGGSVERPPWPGPEASSGRDGLGVGVSLDLCSGPFQDFTFLSQSVPDSIAIFF